MRTGYFTGTYYVKRLFYLNIILFLLSHFTTLGALLYGTFTLSQLLNPIQWVGHVFLHGGWMHLFGNMLTLLFFAPVVEQALGSRKFLITYLIFGALSGIVQLLFNSTGIGLIGASGALFGILTMAVLLQPTMKFFFGIPFKLIFYIIVVLEIFHTFQGFDGIGHIAHLSRAFLGLCLFIKLYGFNAKRWKRDYWF